MRLSLLIAPILGILLSNAGIGQEASHIDLSGVSEGLDDALTSNSMIDAYSCLGSKQSTPQQGTISLDWMETTDFCPNERVAAEFRVENTGNTFLKLPAHPTLTDLLRESRSTHLIYYQLKLELVAEIPAEGAALVAGELALYASLEKPDTFILLPPGESLRVKGDVRMHRSYKRDKTIAVAAGLILSKHVFPDRNDFKIDSSEQKCRLETSESGPQLNAFMHSRSR